MVSAQSVASVDEICARARAPRQSLARSAWVVLARYTEIKRGARRFGGGGRPGAPSSLTARMSVLGSVATSRARRHVEGPIKAHESAAIATASTSTSAHAASR